jgi:hypothetical protein
MTYLIHKISGVTRSQEYNTIASFMREIQVSRRKLHVILTFLHVVQGWKKCREVGRISQRRLSVGLGPRPRWRETLWYRALNLVCGMLRTTLQALVSRLPPLLVHTNKSREVGALARG